MNHQPAHRLVIHAHMPHKIHEPTLSIRQGPCPCLQLGLLDGGGRTLRGGRVESGAAVRPVPRLLVQRIQRVRRDFLVDGFHEVGVVYLRRVPRLDFCVGVWVCGCMGASWLVGWFCVCGWVFLLV